DDDGQTWPDDRGRQAEGGPAILRRRVRAEPDGAGEVRGDEVGMPSRSTGGPPVEQPQASRLCYGPPWHLTPQRDSLLGVVSRSAPRTGHDPSALRLLHLRVDAGALVPPRPLRPRSRPAPLRLPAAAKLPPPGLSPRRPRRRLRPARPRRPAHPLGRQPLLTQHRRPALRGRRARP